MGDINTFAARNFEENGALFTLNTLPDLCWGFFIGQRIKTAVVLRGRTCGEECHNW